MRCVAERRCQAQVEGRIQSFKKGDVASFKTCPPHFRVIKGKKVMPINFENAQEQELLEADYKVTDLKNYIEQKYAKKPGNRGKAKLVDFLLDCRYREIDGERLKNLV